MDLLSTLRSALADRYRIEHELDAGGMARVFRGFDGRHGRSVSVKVLLPELVSHVDVQRFQREISIAAKLSHPHILPILDSGVAAGLPYYVMPYVEGGTLRHRLNRERQISLEDTLQIARELSDALAYAHRSGVVHRDIKPENLLLLEGHVQVADFGIARPWMETDSARLTSSGVTLGTTAYMSPEQLLDSRSVDARSDQYSVACVIYEMLAGQPPFTGPTLEAIAGQHVAARPRPVVDLRPTVPPPTSAALARALSKAPADRFADMRAFGAAMTAPSRQDAPSDIMKAYSAQGRVASAGSSRRRRVAVALAGITIMAVVVGVLISRHRDSTWKPSVGPDGGHPWVIVPEFDGPSDDPQLAEGARELVCTALDQSGLVSTLPRDQVREALNLAGKRDTVRVDAALGRELAYRNAIRTVLEGRVTRVGPGLAIALRLVDAESGRTILAEGTTAEREDQLISTIGSLTRRLRARMGESREAIAANRDLEAITTPSLDAFRKILEGDQLDDAGDIAGTMAAYRRALVLDPDCAAAFARMSVVYHNRELPDSAIWAVNEALRRPNRLAEAEQLYLDGWRADAEGDLPRALDMYDRCVRLYPNDPATASAMRDRASILMYAGRDDEAVRSAFAASARLPFSKSSTDNLVVLVLIQAGRFGEADSVLRLVPIRFRLNFGLTLALFAGDIGRADSLVNEIDHGDDPGLKRAAGEVRAACAAMRGSYVEADSILARLSRNWDPRSGSADPFAWQLLLAGLGVVRLPDVALSRVRDTSAHAVVIKAWHEALAGRPRVARHLLDQLMTVSPGQQGHLGAARKFVSAVLDFREGRWSAVVDSLADIARVGQDLGYLRWNRIGPTTERWLVADAYERLGQPDSAAALLERILGRMPLNDRIPVTLTSNLARLRLVQIYAALGRRHDAERHWANLQRSVSRPDPEIRRRMEAAQLGLSRLH